MHDDRRKERRFVSFSENERSSSCSPVTCYCSYGEIVVHLHEFTQLLRQEISRRDFVRFDCEDGPVFPLGRSDRDLFRAGRSVDENYLNFLERNLLVVLSRDFVYDVQGCVEFLLEFQSLRGFRSRSLSREFE